MKNAKKFLGICLVAMSVAVGCNAGSSGGVAVLDLDKVAKAIGWDEMLNNQLQSRGSVLEGKINQKKEHFEKLIEKSRGELGENPTEEQQQDFMRFQLRANRQLQTDVQSGQQQLVEYRRSMVSMFRDELQPVAAELAEDRELNVVLLNAEPVFYVAEKVDITDALIDRIKGADELKNKLMSLKPKTEKEAADAQEAKNAQEAAADTAE